MNRLDFTQMVNKNLLNYKKNKFFKVSQTNPEEYYEREKQAARIKQAKERLNLDGKINNIVLTLHEQLREQPYIPNSLKVKLKPRTETSKEKFKPKKQLNLNKEEGTNDALHNIECKGVSLPILKVFCYEKQKESAHKSTEATSRYVSYESHKRMQKALRRQNELENMIMEHKLIKADRQSLAQDIFAMRHSLDDLQHRVNSSLKELNNKKTYCECHGLKSKNSCKKCNENL